MGVSGLPQQDQVLAVLLRQKRLSSGYSVSEAATRVGVSRRSLTRWESGAARPRLDEMKRLLEVLNLSEPERRRLLDLLATPAALKEIYRQGGEELPFPLPHQGDLLRALRLRRGWRQEDLAPLLGVNQTTLARWENGNMWPSSALLHQLCYLLRVHEEELAALTMGPYFLSGRETSPNGWGLEALEQSLIGVKRKLDNPHYYVLGDLYYLSLEAQTLPLAQKSEAGRYLLVRILLAHAAYLGERCQPVEAGRVGEQVLAMVPKEGEKWNNLRLQGEMFYTVWKYPMREHARRLRHWLDRRLDLDNRVWVAGQISSSLLSQGQVDLALNMEQGNFPLIAEKGDAKAIAHWRNGYAEFLLSAGRPAEATELFHVSELMTPPSKIRTKLFLSEAHLANGNRTRAHDWLSEAASETNMLGIDYYQPQIASLAGRL